MPLREVVLGRHAASLIRLAENGLDHLVVGER
jgi:hypothetical protein